jgi:hypothetical protein
MTLPYKKGKSIITIRKMIIAEHITVLVAKIGSEIVGSGYARIETQNHI